MVFNNVKVLKALFEYSEFEWLRSHFTERDLWWKSAGVGGMEEGNLGDRYRILY